VSLQQYRRGLSEHWFFGPVIRHKQIYIQVIVASVFINLFALASAFYIMTVYDRVIPNNATETLIALTLGVLVVVCFDLIMKILRGIFTDRAGLAIDGEVAESLFDRLSRNEKLLGASSTGGTANTVKEFDGLKDFLASATFVTFADLPFVILFLFVLYGLGGPIAAVPAVIVLVVIAVGLLIQPMVRRLTANAMADGQSKQSVLVEVLSGLETLKTLPGIGMLRDRWMSSVSHQGVFSAQARFWSQLTSNLSQTGQQLSQVGIVVYGVYLISDGTMTMGSLIACVILSGRTLAPLGQISNLLGRFNQALTAYKNLDQLMSIQSSEESRGMQLRRPEIDGSISFVKATLVYDGQQQPALNEVSLEIKSCEHVAVVGKIGSGKTSILRLVAGLLDPNSGFVKIDDAEVRHLHPDDVRKHIGVVMQMPVMFSGTLKQNLLLGNPDASDEQILEAARLAGVDEIASQLPNGFETVLAERGSQLSGGQRQAVCIARALVGDPKILLLDEPSSAMDSTTERQLLERLKPYLEHRTLVLITHRGTLLDLVDRVIAVDKGKIIADGPKEAMLKKQQQPKIAPQGAST
jgi:ATP-binding cassette subfamily C protein LapB